MADIVVRDIPFDKLVLPGKLDAELRAALGSKIVGVSTSGAAGRVHVDDAATTKDDDATIAAVIAAHDPTPVKVKDADVTAVLAAAPATDVADWLLKQDISQDTLVQALVVKVAMLDKRVAALEGK